MGVSFLPQAVARTSTDDNARRALTRRTLPLRGVSRTRSLTRDSDDLALRPEVFEVALELGRDLGVVLDREAVLAVLRRRGLGEVRRAEEHVIAHDAEL